MPILPSSSQKHDLGGIGAASAASVMAVLAANPSTTALTTGIVGKVIYWILAKFFSGLASMGLVILNVGAEKLITAAYKSNYDGSMESADRLIDEIRKTGRDMSPEEIKKIDDEVIAQFRKFATLARRRK